MEKLLIYYNPSTNAFTNKWVLITEYHEGDFNQYGHLVCQEIIYDFYFKKYVSIGNKNNKYYRRNKKGIIDHLIDLLYRLKKE